ncbi:hypothetical protein [Halobaculum sp. MBLA0143]|uniref:DUF7847 domain-containing protein n=1 Tax=Halobaculum sp. MBLA0143 TaxID=3079933 RepID=UPI003526AB11
MTLSRSLVAAVGAVRKSPALLAVAAVFTVVQIGVVAAQGLVPASALPLYSTATSLVSFVTTPLLLAGIVPLSAAALDGDGGFGTFLAGVREHVLRVFVGFLGLGAVGAVVGVVGVVVFVILSFVVGVGVLAVADGLTAGLALLAFALLFVTLLTVPLVAVHFFAHAITLDGLGVGDAFGRSVAVVRGSLLTTLGYTVVLMAFGTVGFLVGIVGSLDGTPGTFTSTPGGADAAAAQLDWYPLLSTTEAVALQAVGAVFLAVVTAVFWPFSVAVYRELRDRVVEDGGDASDTGDTRDARPL